MSDDLSEVENVWGHDKVQAALPFAVTGAKLGLTEADLEPMVTAYYKMRALGIEPLPGESTIDYGLRMGVYTPEMIQEAAALDMLGMRDERGTE